LKIGTRVSLLMCLLIALIVAGVSAVVFLSERKVLTAEIHNRQLTLVKTLRQAAEESLATKDDILLLNYLKLIRKTEGVSYGMVVNRAGVILAHTDLSKWGTAISDPWVEQVKADQPVTERTLADDKGLPVLDLAMPVSALGETFVRIGFSKEYIDGQVRNVMRGHQKRILVIAAAALALGLALSLGLAQTIVRPIRRLAEATAILGKGKLDHKIEVDSKDELGSLAHDFNVMAEKLLELDQMKKDFVSSVTHELRSPLHSTGMYLGLFEKGGAGELNEKQKTYLKEIEKNTSRLARFIDDLLDVAKIERGKMTVTKQAFDLAELFKDMKAMFEPQSDQKKIKFDVPAAALPKVFADPDRTRQVITNLLSNAFKFTPEGGVVSVEAKPENGHVAVSVRDTGLGIPADQVGSIFEKFEQVKGQQKLAGTPKGTGLGLAIVKGLVEAQGGKIWVESELKKGSCFTFTVPLERSSPSR
jgi:signal transduction histidine kinase